MSWTANEAEQIGRIEGKLDNLSGVEHRVDHLEQFRSYVKGVAAVVSIAVAAWLSTGCAAVSSRVKFELAGGATVECSNRHVVVGKGETRSKFRGSLCPDVDFKTLETGLSDNSVKMGEAVSKGAVKGMKGGL